MDMPTLEKHENGWRWRLGDRVSRVFPDEAAAEFGLADFLRG